MDLTHEMTFPHSVGLFYSAFTAFLGFQVNDGEYKLMGMAAYGQPRYVEKVHKVVDVADDGSIRLNLKYFSFQYSVNRMFTSAFVDLFGEPRTPEESETVDGDYADIAASVQQVTEEILVKMAAHIAKTTGQRRLCMAGGVALNSLANYRILNSGCFDDVYVQPAATDAGGALGAALWAYHHVLGHPRDYVMDHAYWGPQFSEGETGDLLSRSGIGFELVESPDKLEERAVDALVSGKVIGWHQGKMEWGPRALGNRSILADPRRVEMKDTVNTKIKFREPFRPFAPSVTMEGAGEYFNIHNPDHQYPARFMLYVVPVNEGKGEMIPAVTHVDGTARPQIVGRDTNPRYHSLIAAFGQATGVPVLLNTSFNLRGEPIVNRPEEALSTFERSGLDAVALGPFWCGK